MLNAISNLFAPLFDTLIFDADVLTQHNGSFRKAPQLFSQILKLRRWNDCHPPVQIKINGTFECFRFSELSLSVGLGYVIVLWRVWFKTISDHPKLWICFDPENLKRQTFHDDPQGFFSCDPKKQRHRIRRGGNSLSFGGKPFRIR